VPARRIVIVTYFFPPSPAVGALRWASMARHLRARGDDVTVVTSSIHGRLPDDRDSVHRCGDLANLQGLRWLLRRPRVPEPGAAPLQTPAPRLLTRVLVPDSHVVSWGPAALAAVRRASRAAPIDCLITSGPPDSAHLLALALGRRRPPWIADFRDGWLFEPLRDPWPSEVQERVDAWLERRVVTSADVVVGATAPIAEDFKRRFGVDAEWVSNGFDPEATPVAHHRTEPHEPGWLWLVHTGTLSGPRGRDPRPLLAALRAFNDEAADGGPRIRLILAGRPSVEDERIIAGAELGPAIEHVGLLDRSATLRLQREADALLLLTGTHRSEATGKIFEYLAAGRPIIALAQNNEAERIVRETRTGLTVDDADSAALREAFRELADGSLARRHAPRGLERFLYPGPAERISELIDLARSRRRRRSARE
jgi:glycosyltransferase involved in cell wall biosynthesis